MFFGGLWALANFFSAGSGLYEFGKSGSDFFFADPALVKNVITFQVVYFLIAPLTLLICSLQEKLTYACHKQASPTGSGLLNILALLFNTQPMKFLTVLQDIGLVALAGWLGSRVFFTLQELSASSDFFARYSSDPSILFSMNGGVGTYWPGRACCGNSFGIDRYLVLRGKDQCEIICHHVIKVKCARNRAHFLKSGIKRDATLLFLKITCEPGKK